MIIAPNDDGKTKNRMETENGLNHVVTVCGDWQFPTNVCFHPIQQY